MPAQRSTSATSSGGFAAVDAGDEVGGDDVVDREGLEAGHRDARAVGGADDLVGRARVAPAARPVGELGVEDARRVHRVAGVGHVLAQGLLDRGLGGPAIEVGGVDARVARGAVDRLGLVEQLAGEVADAQAAQQRALGLGRVQARGHDGAARRAWWPPSAGARELSIGIPWSRAIEAKARACFSGVKPFFRYSSGLSASPTSFTRHSSRSP